MGDLLRETEVQIARLRAVALRDVRARDGLSMAQLAERVGVSKPRIQQLIQAATRGASDS